MIRTVRLDKNGKLLACPLCDNEELTDDSYCMICGANMDALLNTLREGNGYDLSVHPGQRER